MAAVGATLVVGTAGAFQIVGSDRGPAVEQSTGHDSSVAGAFALSAPGEGTARASAAPGAGADEGLDNGGVGGTMVSGGSNGAGEGDATTGTGIVSAATLPGVGEWAVSRLPAETRQVILVSAPDRASTTNAVTLWQRADETSLWTRQGLALTGRNGANGWTTGHREGDRRSPIGVFSLTAAGGKLPDPGTALPYEYQPRYFAAGSGDLDDPMSAAFNYVVAIDYNRVPGRPPSDPARPLGERAGGDIWLHVDHKAPTKGCVSLPQDELESILRWLQPAGHPMIIMGDAPSLAARNLS
ncbi:MULTISPECIES: L,D-transpeptidase family protein [Pseudofrankia]|uniref:L,D-transpeptidase family protein n=1 Tax=Pseudofrankia TaxID=2994363 RepID=UPI001E4862F4|nr:MULTISPECIES: L,D-transpeptidase family protein [Pseudofrankia]